MDEKAHEIKEAKKESELGETQFFSMKYQFPKQGHIAHRTIDLENTKVMLMLSSLILLSLPCRVKK